MICLGRRLLCICVSYGRLRSHGSYMMTGSTPRLSINWRMWLPRHGRVTLTTAKITCTATLEWLASSEWVESLQKWVCPTCQSAARPTHPCSRGHRAKGTSIHRSGN